MRLGVVAVAAAFVFTLVFAGSAMAAKSYPVDFHNFALNGGTSTGLVVDSEGALTLAPTSLNTLIPEYVDPYAGFDITGNYSDGSGSYVYGEWISGDYAPSFPFTELVSSWNSKTPVGTWIESAVQPKFVDGHWASKWYILGRWSYNDSDFHRTSVGGQGDADGYVAIDTFFAKDHPAVAYRLRLRLFRRTTSTEAPTVSRFSAVASDLRNQKNVFPSPIAIPGETELSVPQYSQETHHGHWPEFDNGGEAWCSPTSTAMVVAYWDAGSGLYAPQPWETTWVDAGIPVADRPDQDPWVDYTARYVYDYHYKGAGNWPFNTAYASERGLVGDVTQLRNLAEAEPFIKTAHIPLVASVAWNSNKLTGADIKSTNGHLLVIRGFTANGDVIANDPASPSDAAVRHVYNREEFERAWIPASGGIVYVIRPSVADGGPNLDSLLAANNS
jgi:Peptidase_C39 like family